MTEMDAQNLNIQKKVSLNINDARAVINLIDILASRGSIKGEELFSVGILRESIKKAIEVTESAE